MGSGPQGQEHGTQKERCQSQPPGTETTRPPSSVNPNHKPATDPRCWYCPALSVFLSPVFLVSSSYRPVLRVFLLSFFFRASLYCPSRFRFCFILSYRTIFCVSLYCLVLHVTARRSDMLAVNPLPSLQMMSYQINSPGHA